jgi:hypothetical protein
MPRRPSERLEFSLISEVSAEVNDQAVSIRGEWIVYSVKSVSRMEILLELVLGTPMKGPKS